MQSPETTPAQDLSAIHWPELPRRGIDPAAAGIILSASGWRGVFAAGDEDSSQEIRKPMLWPAAAMARATAEYFQHDASTNRAVLIGTDSRPTGPALARIIAAAFAAEGIPFSYIGIAAAPEIMAAAREASRYRGFCYVSASHNPVGHNGIKLGRNDGGVLSGEEAAPLIARIRELMAEPETLESIGDPLKGALSGLTTFEPDGEEKQRALNAYSAFAAETLFEGETRSREELRRGLADDPFGVVGELNGSARGASIDQEFLTGVGLKLSLFNRRPGEIAHAILPEEDSLLPCKMLLEEAFAADPAFQIGYVPDNDGDRGNLVYIDPVDGRGRILAAQEVFALSVLAEVAFARYCLPEKAEREAVVVNGPTSLRIDAICKILGAVVHRAEVGEANVVNLARKLRDEGYRVRILGEGSNGGTITHPAAVRDPLNTVGAFAKLLRYRNRAGANPAEEWLRSQAAGDTPPGPITLPRIIASLPAYRTTPTGEARAKFPVKTEDHDRLKTAYERIFPDYWPERPALLSEAGVEGYRFVNYEGIRAFPGPGGRSGGGRGGFKVELYNEAGEARAFLWMRGSGTEPVFRVMADIASDSREAEEELLNWHRMILQAADQAEA